MSDDWKPGDAAWCVRGGNAYNRHAPLQKHWPVSGRIYKVVGTRLFGADLFLSLDDAPDNIDSDGYNWGPLWLAARFRKIRPHTPDAEDAEVIALLNGAGVKEGV